MANLVPTNDLAIKLKSAAAQTLFAKLYGSNNLVIKKNINRAQALLQRQQKLFPTLNKVYLVSSPGRTEVGGNHTDHNGGRVLAATVNVDILAAVTKNQLNQIIIESENFGHYKVDLNDLSMRVSEKFSPLALIKGVAAKVKELGFNIGGFSAVMNSTIPKAAGLSSSAAFECLITEIFNTLYNQGKINQVLNAQISQYAENYYFGKPCGLMDQTTIAVGGLVTIDFKNFSKPLIRKVAVDFTKSGYALVVVNTGGDHADLNDDYIALEEEMKSVAKVFGKNVLRELPYKKVMANTSLIRKKVNDRAVLRAVHFYEDDARVVEQVKALEKNDFKNFLTLVNESGTSSFMYCQNGFTTKNVYDQGIAVGLALSEKLLKNKGAWRLHGGGFAGTIQAFVPQIMVKKYVSSLKKVFNNQSCYALAIRQEGTMTLPL